MPLKDKDARREAHRKYMREVWYPKNAELHKSRAAVGKANNKEWFRQLKAGLHCVDCGENHPACIDFHHLDPSTKLIEVGNAVARNISRDRILAEIEKCIVLCSNCHRKRHYVAGWRSSNSSAS